MILSFCEYLTTARIPDRDKLWLYMWESSSSVEGGRFHYSKPQTMMSRCGWRSLDTVDQAIAELEDTGHVTPARRATNLNGGKVEDGYLLHPKGHGNPHAQAASDKPQIEVPTDKPGPANQPQDHFATLEDLDGYSISATDEGPFEEDTIEIDDEGEDTHSDEPVASRGQQVDRDTASDPAVEGRRYAEQVRAAFARLTDEQGLGVEPPSLEWVTLHVKAEEQMQRREGTWDDPDARSMALSLFLRWYPIRRGRGRAGLAG